MMSVHHCPMCNRKTPDKAPANLPYFPFCSRRCQLIDLAHWLGGDYAIPGQNQYQQPPPPNDNQEKT